MSTNTYEVMFLVDAGAPSFEVACEPVHAMLERADAKVLSIKPWDERKLCYEIKGRKRGLYILTYVEMDAAKVIEFEHDCQLNEKILRILVLRKDKLTQDEIDAETPATHTATQSETVEGETPSDAGTDEKKPAEEKPTEEKPSEKPAEEKPAEEKPATSDAAASDDDSNA